jgi:exonuclease SbcC
VEYLQEIASNANNLLLRLTSGRYFLTYGEKNFEVGDNFNEGKTRGAHTLSGGEIFLVSLSLALSLSSSIQSNSLRPIEFFFLDEGFGTLDDELVDTVMDCLEKLKNDNFSIGIISHVGELKNRLESKIIVDKANEDHGSTLKVY